MDALPPDPPAQQTVVQAQRPVTYAPTEIGPRPDERELCGRAARTDWLYVGAWAAALTASFVAEDYYFKTGASPAVRTVGPALIGLSTGGLLGGSYLALPKCDGYWVSSAPAEGAVRDPWPLALSLALLSAAVAPVVVGVETGPLRVEWSTTERQMRLISAGVFGFVGALVPYLLPPRTWRAAGELDRLRLTASGVSLRF